MLLHALFYRQPSVIHTITYRYNNSSKILNTNIGEKFQDLSCIQDFEADFYRKSASKYQIRQFIIVSNLFYDSASTIKRHLNAAPRSVLQTALSNPHHYL